MGRNPRTRGARFPYTVDHLVTTALTKRLRWGAQRGFNTQSDAESYLHTHVRDRGGRWRIRHGRWVVFEL
jgi:hypothetical protein